VLIYLPVGVGDVGSGSQMIRVEVVLILFVDNSGFALAVVIRVVFAVSFAVGFVLLDQL